MSNSGYERRKQTESRCRKSPISSSRLPFDDDVILDILAEGMEHGTYLELQTSQIMSEVGLSTPRTANAVIPNPLSDLSNIFFKLINSETNLSSKVLLAVYVHVLHR